MPFATSALLPWTSILLKPETTNLSSVRCLGHVHFPQLIGKYSSQSDLNILLLNFKEQVNLWEQTLKEHLQYKIMLKTKETMKGHRNSHYPGMVAHVLSPAFGRQVNL